MFHRLFCQVFADSSEPHDDNIHDTGYIIGIEIICAITNPCDLWVDEAGKGSVLGPMLSLLWEYPLRMYLPKLKWLTQSCYHLRCGTFYITIRKAVPGGNNTY